MSCGRIDKSCYMTDDGRGDVERELRLWWLRACRESSEHHPSNLPPAGHGLGAERSSYVPC